MILAVNIVEGAGGLLGGMVLCLLFLTWKDRNIRKARALETEAQLAKAKTDAEMIVRDARLAANEEGVALREKIEQSFGARLQERTELEKRLSERESLINSQLARIVDAEKKLEEQQGAWRKRSEALERQERELNELTRQGLAQLQKMAALTEEEARAEFLKRVQQEALQEANHLSRHILE